LLSELLQLTLHARLCGKAGRLIEENNNKNIVHIVNKLDTLFYGVESINELFHVKCDENTSILKRENSISLMKDFGYKPL
jgi:hypothetical protein